MKSAQKSGTRLGTTIIRKYPTESFKLYRLDVSAIVQAKVPLEAMIMMMTWVIRVTLPRDWVTSSGVCSDSQTYLVLSKPTSETCGHSDLGIQERDLDGSEQGMDSGTREEICSLILSLIRSILIKVWFCFLSSNFTQMTILRLS